ncbi:hypothetical protein SprV_1002858500 [Sparganum proliferum]
MMRRLHSGMKARIPDNRTCQETKCKCPQGKLNSVLLSLPARHLHFSNELPQRLDNLPIANAADAAVVAANENGSVENSLGHNPVEGAGRPRSRTPPPTTCSPRRAACKKPT